MKEQLRAKADLTAKHKAELNEHRDAVAEANRLKVAAQNEVVVKETAMAQAQQRSSLSTPSGELEGKVKGLTENLVKKQSLIERVQSENMTLTLQLEAERQRLKEVRVDMPSQMTSSSASANPPIRSIQSMMKDAVLHALDDIPSIKNTVGFLDTFSIRLGLFLRRYPAARLIVIAYVIILHIWVMVVLLTYSPDLHDSHGAIDGVHAGGMPIHPGH